MDATTVPATKEKVRHHLAGAFDGVEFDDDGVASFRYGSARVFVSVEVFDEDSSVVVIDSPIVKHVDEDPELYKFIATRSGSAGFGHLFVSGSGDDLTVHFGHTLLGDFLDDMELRMAAVAVAVTSDQLDDEIQSRFGGERFHEDEGEDEGA